jgi:2-haloacid dehalogenase
MSPVPETVLAFDVNETLLDLKSLDPFFVRTFDDASLRPTWFAQMLQLSFAGIITGRYLDFPSAQHAALRMVARRRGVEVDEQTADEIVGTMDRLAPHPEVRRALERLREAGFKIASLTNSPPAVAEAQLVNAEIHDLFDAVISADEVRRLKPAPEPYHHAAKRLGVEPGNMRLIAAHWWDVDGALAAGCLAAFVARPGAVLNPATPIPDIVEPDIARTADAILRIDVPAAPPASA